MVLVRNSIRVILITVFLSVTTVYADSSNSDNKRNSVVRSGSGNILAEILEIVYNLGVDLGTAIKLYMKGD